MSEIELVRADIAGSGQVPIADGQGGYAWGAQLATGANPAGWQANTPYLEGQQVTHDNQLYAALTSFTSASTWTADESNWLLLGQVPAAVQDVSSAYAANKLADEVWLPAPLGGSSDDTSAVQAVLNAYAGTLTRIRSRVGRTYNITQLTLPGGVHWDATKATFVQPAGTNKPGIINAAAVAQRSVTDGSMTLNGNVVSSATAAFSNADIGRMVRVCPTSFPGTTGTGPGPAGGPYYGKITAVGTGSGVTTATVTAAHSILPNATASVSGQLVQIFARDSGLRLTGGNYVFGNNDGTASSYLYGPHHMVLHRIDGLIMDEGLSVDSSAATIGKYGVVLGDVTDFTARDITVNTYSDGFHLQGPCRRGVIDGLRGSSINDDFFPLICGDYPEYSDLGAGGDITGIHARNIQPSSAGNRLVVVLGGAGCFTDDIHIDGVEGTSVTTPVYLGDSQNDPLAHGQEANGTWGDVEVTGISVTPPASTPAVAMSHANIGRIKLGINYRQNTSNQAAILCNPYADLLGKIEVDINLSLNPGVTQPRIWDTNNSNNAIDHVVCRPVLAKGMTAGASSFLFTASEPSGSGTTTINHLEIISPLIECTDGQLNITGTGTAKVAGGFKKVTVNGGRIVGVRTLHSNVVDGLNTDLVMTGGLTYKNCQRVLAGYGPTNRLRWDPSVTIEGLVNPAVVLQGSQATAIVEGGPPIVVGSWPGMFTLATPATTVSGTGQTFPQATLTVATVAGAGTAAFPSSGTLTVAGVTGTVTYTGVSQPGGGVSIFTGCTGGSGTATNGGAVTGGPATNARVNGIDLQADVSKLNPSTGDKVNNTNASAAATGPVIWSGLGWDSFIPSAAQAAILCPPNAQTASQTSAALADARSISAMGIADADMTIGHVRFPLATVTTGSAGSDPIEIAVYDAATGSELATTGVVTGYLTSAISAAPAIRQIAFTGSFTVKRGQKIYATISQPSHSGTAATLTVVNAGAVMTDLVGNTNGTRLGGQAAGVASPLPATLPALSSNSNYVPMALVA